MTFTPVNVAEITEALRAQIDDAPGIEDATVERAEALPTSASRCPWVGVYRTRAQLPVRTLGVGSGFRGHTIELAAVCLERGATGAECEDRVEMLVQSVLAAILNDTTLGGRVLTLDEIEVRYESYDKSEGHYMQRVAVYLSALTQVQSS